MKRREFLNSMFAVGATAIMTAGCGKKEIIQYDGEVAKRKFKDMEVPLLGFGCMRLPMKGKEIDMFEFEQMVEEAIRHGVNYFDTAYMYVDGKSETALGKALKKYKRNEVIIADKSPTIFMHSKDDVKKIFEEQLKKCQTDYFDFYLIHNINKNTIDNYKNFDMYNQIMDFKRQGLVKNVGFSFHGTPDMLKEITEENTWDFAQLQLNYFDWNIMQAQEQYNIVQSHEIPVIVMEPLRGGVLCNLSDKALEKLYEFAPNDTPASYGLRWAASRNNVITVLSGMSNLDQMIDNIETFENYIPVTTSQDQQTEELASIIQSEGEINCTACKYCIELCPAGINIPAAFSLYNQYKLTNNKNLFAVYYDSIPESERPHKCIKCGLCKTNCPQNIEIPELLAKIVQLRKEIQA